MNHYDPLKDYYQILHVSPDADLADIKQSYRALAMKVHPDRGGTHEAMVELTLAFEILSNPETRRHYDQARREMFNQNAQSTIHNDISQAQQKAEQYPRNWDDFDTWLHRDFTSANYGTIGKLPTVSNSVSGCLFWIIGAIAGVFICVSYGARGTTRTILIISMIAFAMWLHKKIGSSMSKPQLSPPATNQKTTIQCQRCGQGLRTPPSKSQIRLRCPNCKFEFDFR